MNNKGWKIHRKSSAHFIWILWNIETTQREPDDKPANKWEFTGGKIEHGETQRNIKSELKVNLSRANT